MKASLFKLLLFSLVGLGSFGTAKADSVPIGKTPSETHMVKVPPAMSGAVLYDGTGENGDIWLLAWIPIDHVHCKQTGPALFQVASLPRTGTLYWRSEVENASPDCKGISLVGPHYRAPASIQQETVDEFDYLTYDSEYASGPPTANQSVHVVMKLCPHGTKPAYKTTYMEVICVGGTPPVGPVIPTANPTSPIGDPDIVYDCILTTTRPGYVVGDTSDSPMICPFPVPGTVTWRPTKVEYRFIGKPAGTRLPFCLGAQPVPPGWKLSSLPGDVTMCVPSPQLNQSPPWSAYIEKCSTPSCR
jgi:hypothetical protein